MLTVANPVSMRKFNPSRRRSAGQKPRLQAGSRLTIFDAERLAIRSMVDIHPPRIHPPHIKRH